MCSHDVISIGTVGTLEGDPIGTIGPHNHVC